MKSSEIYYLNKYKYPSQGGEVDSKEEKMRLKELKKKQL